MVAVLTTLDRPAAPATVARVGGGTDADRWPLLGRDDELALIDAAVTGGRSVVVVGPAGVGRSRLLAEWVARRDLRPDAEDRRLRRDRSGRGVGPAGPRDRRVDGSVVVVRATRSTATIPFGAFARWVPERHATHDRLGLFQATAAALLGDRSPATGSPLVLVVDDAPLLDDGSAALVLHLAQHTATRVVAAVRTGVPCPDAITALAKEGLADRVDLAPLDPPTTAELARVALGGRVAVTALRRLWRLTEGNPLYLREVLAAARDQGVLAVRGGRWSWDGDLAGRGRLHDLVSDRLGAADPEERRLLELVALGEPLPVDVLARLVPPARLAAAVGGGVTRGPDGIGLDVDGAGTGATGEAGDRTLLVEERLAQHPAGPVVRLAHPLYAEVIRAGLSRFATRHRLGELARAAVAAGYHRQDPLRVATWQVDGDDPGDPDLLLRAARVASMIDEAALSERLARAAEGAGAGWPAVLQRAEALGPVGRWDEADALLDALTRPEAPVAARVAGTVVRAEALIWHRGRSVAEARDVVARGLAAIPAGAAAPLQELAARLAFADLDLDAAGTLAAAAVSGARTTADRLHAVGTAALVTAFRGHAEAAVQLAAAAQSDAAALASEDPRPAGRLLAAVACAAPLAGRLDETVAVLERVVDHDVLAAFRSLRGFPVLCLARARLAQGRVATAARLCDEVLTTMVGDENHYGRGNWVVATLAAAAGQAGDARAAGEALAWIDDHRPFPLTPDRLGLDLGRVWLHAARGELSSARALALAVAEQAGAAGCGLLEATALVDAARLGAAGEVADRLTDLAGRLGGPFLPVAARFARGLAAPTPSGEDLDAAAAGFVAAGARLLAAEALTAAAEAHGARGRRRAEAASRARAQRLAGECEGASTPLLRRLVQAAPAARLTPREREVAELAARGRSNREIAEALHVSRRTVDSHLDHAYTKLGITTRHELPAALGFAVA